MALIDNIVGYWKMDGNSNDSVGSANGTDTSITYSVPNGKINEGGGFVAASNSRSLVGAVGGTGVALATFNCWAKVPNTTGNLDRVLVGYNGWSTNGQFSFEMFSRDSGSTYNRILFYVYGSNPDGSSVANAKFCTTDIGDGNWHMITSVVNTTTRNISYYVDGSFVNTVNFATALPAISLDNLILGSWFVGGGYRSYNDAIDEIGIWTRELSAGEISQLYNGGVGVQYPFVDAGNYLPIMHHMQIAGGLM